MREPVKRNWGGFRPGAGRKPKKPGPKKPVRRPPVRKRVGWLVDAMGVISREVSNP